MESHFNILTLKFNNIIAVKKKETVFQDSLLLYFLITFEV